MELLVKRDTNSLVKTEGKAFVDSDLPNFLKVPRVVPQTQVTRLNLRDENDDLIIDNSHDYIEMQGHLSKNHSIPFIYNPFSIPGIWSGYRSSLVYDPRSKKWFKLKGVSLDPINPKIRKFKGGSFDVEGGLLEEYAEYEKIMSDKFNSVLENEGIEPAMKVKGIWRYLTLAKRKKLAASVMEVKGDTRLDELIFILEGLATPKFHVQKNSKQEVTSIGSLSSVGADYFESLGAFYFKVGFTVGRLKKLMDLNNQTWSSDYHRTNAHFGNVVVYNGSDTLKIGLVDFNASCDLSDFSKSKIKSMQYRERQTIKNSFMGQPISPRQINGKPFRESMLLYTPYLRSFLVRGFEVGYEHDSSFYSNVIDLSDLKKVFSLLRQPDKFSHAKISRGMDLSDILDILKYSPFENDASKEISLEKVIYSNHKYEKSLYVNDYLKDQDYLKYPDYKIKDNFKLY